MCHHNCVIRPIPTINITTIRITHHPQWADPMTLAVGHAVAMITTKETAQKTISGGV